MRQAQVVVLVVVQDLPVDDVAVIADTQEDLIGSNAGLHIGAARALGPGLFWSGLIDDVRIYNRAVHP